MERRWRVWRSACHSKERLAAPRRNARGCRAAPAVVEERSPRARRSAAASSLPRFKSGSSTSPPAASRAGPPERRRQRRRHRTAGEARACAHECVRARARVRRVRVRARRVRACASVCAPVHARVFARACVRALAHAFARTAALLCLCETMPARGNSLSRWECASTAFFPVCRFQRRRRRSRRLPADSSASPALAIRKRTLTGARVSGSSSRRW